MNGSVLMSRWNIVKDCEKKLLKFIADRAHDDREIIEMNKALELITKYFYGAEQHLEDLEMEKEGDLEIKLSASQSVTFGTALIAISEVHHDNDRISLSLGNVSVELIVSQQMTAPYLRRVLISITEKEKEDGD